MGAHFRFLLALASASIVGCAGDSFDLLLYYPQSSSNSSSGDACSANSTIVTLSTGCQAIGTYQVQFDCTDEGALRLATGYSDSACEVEGSSGLSVAIVERPCTVLDASGPLYQILNSRYGGLVGTKDNPASTAVPDSPCLTEFEEFEQDLGLELLDIFGLNNITNATDPVLFEVKEILFTYGIVFVAGMCLLGLLLCIVGHKFFWLTLFIGGFAVLGYLGYFAWIQVTLALNVDVAIVAKGILPSFVACGILGGLLAWKFLKLGVFVLGACFGGAIGYLLYMSVIQSFWSESWGLYVVVGGCGLLFGVIFVFKYKFFVVVCTAIIGSFLITSGVSFLIGYYPSLSDIEDVEVRRLLRRLVSH